MTQDQEQTPEHAAPGGKSWPDYRVDGECVEQCDCGDTNPCAEYIFDNRGGKVEGRNFTEWFIDEYMITNETLLHKNPQTGKPQVIGLGWLDDSIHTQFGQSIYGACSQQQQQKLPLPEAILEGKWLLECIEIPISLAKKTSC